MGQAQYSLISQLNSLAELAKANGMMAATIARILHGNHEPLTDLEVRSQLLKCITLANQNGLYDAADQILHRVLGLN